MESLKDLLLEEVRKGFEKEGLRPFVDFFGGNLVITLSKHDVEKLIMGAFPEHLKPLIQIEATEIKIKVKVI